MKKGIVVLLGLLLSVVAFADVGVKWEQPLLYDNGDAMDAGDIESFELHYTVDETFKEMSKPIVINASERSYMLELSLPAKLVPYTISMGLKTRSIYGGVSDMSNVVVTTFTVQDDRKPQAPVNIRLSITCGETCTIVDQTVETIK